MNYNCVRKMDTSYLYRNDVLLKTASVDFLVCNSDTNNVKFKINSCYNIFAGRRCVRLHFMIRNCYNNILSNVRIRFKVCPIPSSISICQNNYRIINENDYMVIDVNDVAPCSMDVVTVDMSKYCNMTYKVIGELIVDGVVIASDCLIV